MLNRIISYYDNYIFYHPPFGMLMPGRSYTSGSQYRFGFNGKENDNDVIGEGKFQDYGMRSYDPRLGRFISVDPLTKKFAFYSTYQFAGNKPIIAVDLDGEEEKIKIYYAEIVNRKLITKSEEIQWNKLPRHEHEQHGPLGTGTLFVRSGKHVPATFTYFPSMADDLRKLLTFSLPQIMVWGSSGSGDEGLHANWDPKSKSFSFNYYEFEKMMLPILTGMTPLSEGKSSISNEEKAGESIKAVFESKEESNVEGTSENTY